MTKFQPGDVVQLRSGGPDMTVRHVSTWEGNVLAHCEWFVDGQLASANFLPSSLRKLSSEAAIPH